MRYFQGMLTFESKTLLLASLCLSVACGDDTSATSVGSTGDDSTGTTTTMPLTTTMPATTMPGTESMTGSAGSGSTGSTGILDSSSGTPDPDTSTGPDPGTDSSSGEPTAPEIEVSIDAVVLADGDGYDFLDTVDVGAAGTATTVTIENVGTADLNVAGVTITAGDDTHFTVDTAVLDAVVAPAATTTFTVAFSPLNGGLKDATVSIDNDDADEAPFDIVMGAHTTPNTYRDLAPGAGPSARQNPALVDLQDGRLLLFGGRDVAGTRLNDTWVFDVEAGTWTDLMPMAPPPARDAHEMVYAGSDTAILFGGNSGPAIFDDTWSFDALTGEWTMMAPMASPPPRFRHHMTTVADGMVMLYSGRVMFGMYLDDAWMYDVMTDSWTDLAPMGLPSGRSAASMDFDGTGTVTLFGGFDDDGMGPANPLDETWNYDVAGNTWTQGAPVTTPGSRFVQRGAYFAGGSFITHSGKQSDCCTDPDPGTFAYDPMADDWTDLTPASEPTPRFGYSMAYVMGTNKAILFGGNFTNAGTAGVVDETWEYVGPLP